MENSSSSVSTNDHRQYLNNLPDLVYYHILKNLDLEDLWNSRLISKRFYSIIKNFHINELTFQEVDSFGLDNWFTTTRPTRPEYQLPRSRLHRSKLDLLSHPSNNLLSLKYLRTVSIGSFRLDYLNKFTKLQILEIGFIKLNSHYLLQLPDLKALHICRFSHESKDGSLFIDTPNLHSLAIQNGCDLIRNKVKFSHLLSIKYLRIDNYDKNALIFPNLECLEICFGCKSLESSDLLKLHNLKSLRFSDIKDVDKLKDVFSSKENHLEFVIDGVKIKEIKKIDEYINSKRSRSLVFQLNNYGELKDDLWFLKSVSYENLLSLLPANQLADLFTKFTNIQTIMIESRIEDVSRLIRFIGGCPNLLHLNIGGSSFNQQFYDQLPTIKSLFFFSLYEEKNLNLDFKFLMKMPYLRALSTDQDILISQLNLNNFKRLINFKFKIGKQVIEVTKLYMDKNRYKIDNFKNLGLPEYNYMKHDDLIEWSNQLRCKKR